MNTPTVSPVEYVRSLSPEDKEAVFAELIREVIRINGGKEVIPVDGPDGEPMGYYVPLDTVAERCGPQLTEEDRERTNRALAEPDRTFNIKEFFTELRREDERPS